MRAIAVDDEVNMLERLTEAVSSSPDIESVRSFSSCTEALLCVGSDPVDIAFLAIRMKGMGGLRLAERIMACQPHCKIVFCTGYAEYAVDAFRIHASGYLLKPITREAVQREIDYIKSLAPPEKGITVKCFGNFEILCGGRILPFKRSKTKELLAILIDRGGAGMTAKQICSVLFSHDSDDAKNLAYLRQLVLDLRSTLRTVGAEEVLQHDTPYYRIDPTKIQCDYLSYLETGSPAFHGEYMAQYSWAEETCAMLQFKK